MFESYELTPEQNRLRDQLTPVQENLINISVDRHAALVRELVHVQTHLPAPAKKLHNVRAVAPQVEQQRA
jgi:hypothetical protein